MSLALIAGTGRLPHLVADGAAPAAVLELDGQPSGIAGAEPFRLERLGSVLAGLRRRGVTQVCMAGAIRRPAFDPAAADAETAPLLSSLAKVLGQGDDAALRIVIALVEAAGLAVVAPQALLPGLLPPPGVPTAAAPAPRDRADAGRARAILAALSAADLGQACAVAGGQALAVEAAGGTAWMLASLAADRPPAPSGGVLVKAPKAGQEMRVDAPAIGPDTPPAAAAAGLSGIAVPAGGVLVIDRAATVAACDAAGLFLWIME